jgi:hypothetical protein
VKVYVVFEGSYSDRNVAQIFSSEEKAKGYLAFRCRAARKSPGRKDDTDDQIINALELDICDYEVDGDYVA